MSFQRPLPQEPAAHGCPHGRSKGEWGPQGRSKEQWGAQGRSKAGRESVRLFQRHLPKEPAAYGCPQGRAKGKGVRKAVPRRERNPKVSLWAVAARSLDPLDDCRKNPKGPGEGWIPTLLPQELRGPNQ